jgi:hypothetical protein
MEKLIGTFLDTKYPEPFIIRGIPYPIEKELYLRSGKNLLAYALVREGDLYSYIDWMVPTITLKEILPYFDKDICSLEKIMLEWMKNKVAEQGYNLNDVSIIRQLCKETSFG